MQIMITGRHIKVTEAMQTYARDKASKFEKIWNGINKAHITMDLEHGLHVAEAVVSINGGADVVAITKDADMYAALDLLENKIEQQLRKYKSKHQDHHPHQKNHPKAPSEPTYQDIVREELDPS